MTSDVIGTTQNFSVSLTPGESNETLRPAG